MKNLLAVITIALLAACGPMEPEDHDADCQAVAEDAQADSQPDAANPCGDRCAAESCLNGVCTQVAECSGVRVDTMNDSNNCGTCGNVCGLADSCLEGRCTRVGVCQGVETDLSNDPMHCGACEARCAPGLLCTHGACVCPTAGELYCGGVIAGCVNLHMDTQNCGACGNHCGDGFTCSNGTCCPPGEDCSCPTGTTYCGAGADGNACRDLDHDSLNCGGCGVACSASQTCIEGSCQ